jgi:hypothetical protein
MDRLPLADLLDGNLPPSDEPIHRLEKPHYKRDGLYGQTPFKPREVATVALTTEQVCLHCGTSHLGFGGIFHEFMGMGEDGPLKMRTPTKALKSEIQQIIHTTENVPYCPTCLGEGSHE